MPATTSKGRKVKSAPIRAGEVADHHERAKDYLSPAEVARLLDAAKPAVMACATICFCS